MKVLHGFTESVILTRRQEMQNNSDESKVTPEGSKRKKLAFLDLLLKLQLSGGDDELTDQDIREEVDTFMFEGHDTTACSLAWTLFLIGNHPQVQERLYNEQIDIFGENGTHDDVEQIHFSKMKYLEACIKESLRLYPSVPIIGRKAEKRVVVDGFTLEKGAGYSVVIHILHRNPLIWEKPNEFIPERFMDDSTLGSKKRHPYAYVPFSAGPRNCIGQKFAMMEEKTVLSKVIRRIRVQSMDKVEDVRPVVEIITRPHCGVNAKVYPR
jgi:cytochrome P450